MAIALSSATSMIAGCRTSVASDSRIAWSAVSMSAIRPLGQMELPRFQ